MSLVFSIELRSKLNNLDRLNVVIVSVHEVKKPREFSCIPKVSSTSMNLEVIEGKNTSLVCSIALRKGQN